MDEKKKCLGRNSLLSGPSLTWGSSSGQNSMWRLISVHACMLSCVQFFAILWTVARQASLSVRFPGRNTGVGCYSLLLRIFSTQGSNPCHLRLLHWQADSLSLSHLGDWYSEYFKIVSEVRPIASLSEFQSSIHLPLLPEDRSFSPGTSVLGQSSFYGWIFWSRVEWVPKNWCFWTVVLEKTPESPLDCKEIQPDHPKGDQSWVFSGRTDAEAETPILWPPDVKNCLIWKDPDTGRDWRPEEKGTTEGEMVGCHHRLDRHEFE